MILIPSPRFQEQGWTQRFTAMGLRLREAVELYHQLGYEVHLEPAALSEEQFDAEACKHCFVTTQARTIYTRPQANQQPLIPGEE